MVDVEDLVLGELVCALGSQLGLIVLIAVVAVVLLAVLGFWALACPLLRCLRLLLVRLLQLLPPEGLLVLLPQLDGSYHLLLDQQV